MTHHEQIISYLLAGKKINWAFWHPKDCRAATPYKDNGRYLLRANKEILSN